MTEQKMVPVTELSRLVRTIRDCTIVYRKGHQVTTKQVNGIEVTTIDAFPERPELAKVIDLHFVWVGFTESVAAFMDEVGRARFTDMVRAAELGEFASMSIQALKTGPSYITIGAWLGDQGLALQFMGLVEFLGLGKVITPATLHFDGECADEMAGKGYVMCLWTTP